MDPSISLLLRPILPTPIRKKQNYKEAKWRLASCLSFLQAAEFACLPACMKVTSFAFVLNVKRIAICYFSPIRIGVGLMLNFVFFFRWESEIPPFPKLLKDYFSNDNET